MKRRLLIILILAGIAGLLFLFFRGGEKEPEYNGKKLSQWLEVLNVQSGYYGGSQSASWEEGRTAVQHIGTNAVPALLNTFMAM